MDVDHGSWRVTYGLRSGCGLWVVGCGRGLWVAGVGCGLWVAGCGLWVWGVGYGLRAVGYGSGAWVMGNGLWDGRGHGSWAWVVGMGYGHGHGYRLRLHPCRIPIWGAPIPLLHFGCDEFPMDCCVIFLAISHAHGDPLPKR
jgi:hypothetical protein